MVDVGFGIDTRKDEAGLKYLQWLRDAFESGKSFGALIRDVAELGWGNGQLQASEYFLYRLYDDKRFPAEVKRTFLGADRQTQLLTALNMPWPKIAEDKPTLSALLRGHDLPIPETQALRHPHRTFPGAIALRNRSDVERFLRVEADYPLFTKPANMRCSLGVTDIDAYNRDSDCIVTKWGGHVAVGEFVEQIENYSDNGYLFQTRLKPHAELAKIVGAQISTVRMFVLVDDNGPTLLRASWKIPSGESVADNFWRHGNMLAGLDIETGSIIRVLRRSAKGTESVDKHPRTGASFTGLCFPHWDQMRDLVMRGAAAVPSCHFQGWDVALTDCGPVLVELEGDGGDPIMEQLCFDSGLLQGRFLDFAKRTLDNKTERSKKGKARRLERLRANFAQLAAKSWSSDEAACDTPQTEELAAAYR